jgi:hypothetical protein
MSLDQTITVVLERIIDGIMGYSQFYQNNL